MKAVLSSEASGSLFTCAWCKEQLLMERWTFISRLTQAWDWLSKGDFRDISGCTCLQWEAPRRLILRQEYPREKRMATTQYSARIIP